MDKLKTSSTKNYVDSINNQLVPAESIFDQHDKIPKNFTLFKYILENSSNKNINIQYLCKGSGIDIRNYQKQLR